MRLGGGTAPSRGEEDVVEWSEKVEKKMSLLDKEGAGGEAGAWVVYLTTLGYFGRLQS